MKIGGKQYISKLPVDTIAQEIAAAFDFEYTGQTVFSLPEFDIPNAFNIGLIVGPSGSGKSSLLSEIGQKENCVWDNSKSVCSHFASADDAKAKLAASGLNSVPAMLRSYSSLSTGEKYRAELARMLKSNAVIDEFTSVVDRNVAKSCAFAVQRYIRSSDLKQIVFASCHYDVIDWLMPDWVLDTRDNTVSIRGLARRPRIEIDIIRASPKLWGSFSDHHYLSGNINNSSRCWVAFWGNQPVGFVSALAFPNGNFKNAWRGHRTVVLPDFQGLGIGVRISDAVGEIIKAEGGRFFSKTASSRMGEYREKSAAWRATSKNKKGRPDYKHGRKTKESNHKMAHVERICYSHEYVGVSHD